MGNKKMRDFPGKELPGNAWETRKREISRGMIENDIRGSGLSGSNAM